jgi:hypothetical protein
MSASAALQAALHQRLTADASLTALIGPARIHDRTPAAAEFPYVTFGQTASDDWSTGSEQGEAHFIRLHAWSRMPGRKEALAIAEACQDAIQSTPLSLSGHRLVLLRRTSLEAAYDVALRGFRATLTFEALTEAL